jgi:small-conductance mechanosensitive channel
MIDLSEFTWTSWTGLAVAVVIALATVVIIVAIISVSVRILARRWPGIYATLGSARRRLRVVIALIATWIAMSYTLPDDDLRAFINQAFLVALISAIGWLLTAVIALFFDRVQRRFDINDQDNRVARRLRTQVVIIRRLATVLVAILTVAAILLTFPGAQAAGASLLASAGLVSVVAGLAAQSSLANVFAGMQLAFSDALRLDDVVIVEGEFGRVEEITLTYVVVGIWDRRRMILPSTHFTTQPFENWTRNSSELLGTVMIDLDWAISPAALRAELETILATTEMWDGQASGMQITEATGGLIRARILVSAVDASTLWDLRCLVRERLVEWMFAQQPDMLPRSRVTSQGEGSSTDPDALYFVVDAG